MMYANKARIAVTPTKTKAATYASKNHPLFAIPFHADGIVLELC